MKKKNKCFVLALIIGMITVISYAVIGDSNIGTWLGGLGVLAFIVLGSIGVFGCKSD